MLKRLLLLGLLCAAFLLLMSLMVVSAAEDMPPRVPAVETAFLPARAELDFSGNVQFSSPVDSLPAALADQSGGNAFCEFLLLRCGRPYFQVFYHAFHFSDRAG